MDDILVGTETIKEHLEVLKEVFITLNDNNVQLQMQKCCFVKTSVEYLGYTLSQDQITPSDKHKQKQNNKDVFKPVLYFNRKSTEVETKMHSFELETLAVVYAVQRFRIYLHGIHFTIITDCSALKWASWKIQ